MAQLRTDTSRASAADLREGRAFSYELEDAVAEIERRIQDERPAYPGAWVGQIEELERRNANQSETIGGYAEENEELRVQAGQLQERVHSLEDHNEYLQKRVHELVDQSNSLFDEIVEAIADFREISGWAAAVADRLDR